MHLSGNGLTTGHESRAGDGSAEHPLATFFDVDAMREALPEMLTVGLPNTLILAVSSAVLGTVLGLLLAVAGLSRSRWLRWPARVYTDIFRGLPAA